MKAISKFMSGQISKKQFLKINGTLDMVDRIEKELVEAYQCHSADNVEEFIYLIFVFEYFNVRYTDILNHLLISDWHYQHENIVILLQKICSFDSLPYLYKAIELQLPYYQESNNCAFEMRCIRAIYQIGKKDLFSYLEKLCRHSNDDIREMAQRQIKKLM